MTILSNFHPSIPTLSIPRSNRILLLALSLALAVGCGASASANLEAEAPAQLGPPTPLVVERPFYIPGEVMRFELSLHNIVGGEAILAVGQPGKVEGRDVIVVRSQSKSAGVAALFKEVSDDVTTWVDLVSGKPTQLVADVKFGAKEALIETSFSGRRPGRFDIDYTRRGRGKRTVMQQMPNAGTYDGHSVLGVLRAWAPPTGTQSYFYVLAGKRLWSNEVKVAGREKITTKLGHRNAIKIEGIAWRLDRRLARVKNKKSRSYTIWISDDEQRLPIRVSAQTEYGEVKVELVNHTVAAAAAR